MSIKLELFLCRTIRELENAIGYVRSANLSQPR